MGQEEGKDFPPKKSDNNSGVEFPAKKLARQLDFTQGSVVLPEHPQSQRHHVTPPTPPIAQKPMAAQNQLPTQVVTVPHMQHQHLPGSRKLESPKSRSRPNTELKEGTPKKQKQCNCKHSRCLKLYCECFASGTYCDGCNCANCYNNVENESARREAVEATLERNPNAFRPKIAGSPHGTLDSQEDTRDGLILAKHNKGCHCKKSGCLKKYCECFQANILCSENCKCMDCKNYEGSEERLALFHGDQANNMAYIQQAANAAITGAIGSSGYASTPVPKKKKGQELFFGPTTKGPAYQRIGNFQQASHIWPSLSSSSFPDPLARAGTNTTPGASKISYRSLLADIIQPQDVKELCSVLAVLSETTAKTLAAMPLIDERNATEKCAEDGREICLASSTQGRLQSKGLDTEKAVANDHSSTEDNKIDPDDLNSDGADALKGRPMSPGTLALMCDEHDTMFLEAAFPSRLTDPSCSTSQLSDGQGVTEVYAEQERIILTKFRDCLNRLITFGEIKETNYSLARSELGNLKDTMSNDTGRARPELNNLHGSLSNDIADSAFPPASKPSSSTAATSVSELPRKPALPQSDDNQPKS
ncbi:hypothetical protein K2173_015936 [Erythroxylum novogranatense]|uniref:CRC domain-containing protein n=1 Tax=Erythroxylum novogranatense TaxID=1862640 RepID=A0AAV8SFE0_9ROSI|nr:hypothetical protein K2173_015936 [Erythroxylum novogranatense]